jgi:hypothetical protein
MVGFSGYCSHEKKMEKYPTIGKVYRPLKVLLKDFGFWVRKDVYITILRNNKQGLSVRLDYVRLFDGFNQLSYEYDGVDVHHVADQIRRDMSDAGYFPAGWNHEKQMIQ